MSDLRDKRKEYSEEELQQAEIHIKYMLERRKRFNDADTHLFLQKNQNDTDLLNLSSSILEFKRQLKPESKNHKAFEELGISLMRVQGYCLVIESTSKSAVAEYISERIINEQLKSEIRKKDLEIMQLKLEPGKLKKEIEKLKGQLEFHEKK